MVNRLRAAVLCFCLLLAAYPASAAKVKKPAAPAPAAQEQPAEPAKPARTPSTPAEQKLEKSPFYDQINEAAKKKQGTDLLEFLDASVVQDATLLPVAALWLRQNSIEVDEPARINSLFFASYADMLFALADGEKGAGHPDKYRALYKTALLNLYIFEAMARVDGARCQDPTAAAAVRAMVKARQDSVELGYQLFPRSIFEEIEKSALREEDKNLLRPANTDICAMGRARLVDLSRQQGVMERIIPDPRYKDGKRKVYIPPAGYRYYPAIVPDGEWLQARSKILQTVSDGWAAHYGQKKP